MKTWKKLLWVSLLLFSILGCDSNRELEQILENGANSEFEEVLLANERKKVLYVDSYSDQFDWVKDIQEGIFQGFKVYVSPSGVIDTNSGLVNLQVYHMDTRRKSSPEDITSAVVEARSIIDTWQPDVIIASDDNASKYLIAPFYKNVPTPVVFCGINWNADEYGFPANNITGMLEVTLVPTLIQELSRFTEVNRVGFLSVDNESERKNATYFEKEFRLNLVTDFATNFSDFQKKFLQMQNEVDVIILGNIPAINGYDMREMLTWLRFNTRIPTGGLDSFIAPFVLVACAKTGVEQGLWSAATALRIIEKTPPSLIPIEKNFRAHMIYNSSMALKLGITLTEDMVKDAEIIY